MNHCGVVPTVLRVLVPEVGDWNWEMESRTGCRDGSGKDKPGKGRPAVAVRRQETIWNLLQEMDSKVKSILRELLLELLSNASGGIYPRAR